MHDGDILGRAGARVAVIEQRPDPTAYKTICTHFIAASATPTIERLGLAERIEAAGGVRNAVELWTRFGWIRATLADDFAYPRYGYDIRREKLDPMVRDLAAAGAGRGVAVRAERNRAARRERAAVRRPRG